MAKKHKFDRPPQKPPIRGYYGSYYWDGMEYQTEDEAWQDYREWLAENPGYNEGNSEEETK